MKYVAYCEGRKVCTVQRRRHSRRYEIVWHSRQDASEPIVSFEAAKTWVAELLHGKHVEWRIE